MAWYNRTIGELMPTFGTKVSTGISEWSDKRRLEKNLLKRKETAREYEQNRVPAGHAYYKLLYDACIADISQFCTTYPRNDVKLMTMSYPFLFALGKKANPSSKDDRTPGFLTNAFAGVIAIVLLAFGTGMASGLFTGGHDLVQHFFV